MVARLLNNVLCFELLCIACFVVSSTQSRRQRSVKTLTSPSSVKRSNPVFLDEEEEEEEEENEEHQATTKAEVMPGPSENDGQMAQPGNEVTVRPAEDRPRGPVVLEKQLEDRFATRFTSDAENKVPFVEPEVIANCWVQAILSNKYHFTPQCNGDGSFAGKQCHLERCWCVNRDGTPQIHKPADRFYYEIRGVTLRCIQNGIPV